MLVNSEENFQKELLKQNAEYIFNGGMIAQNFMDALVKQEFDGGTILFSFLIGAASFAAENAGQPDTNITKDSYMELCSALFDSYSQFIKEGRPNPTPFLNAIKGNA